VVLRKPNRFPVGLSVKKPILQPLSSVIQEEVAVEFSSSTATRAKVTVSIIPCSGLDHICARIIAPNKKIFFSAEFSLFSQIFPISIRPKKRGSLRVTSPTKHEYLTPATFYVVLPGSDYF